MTWQQSLLLLTLLLLTLLLLIEGIFMNPAVYVLNGSNFNMLGKREAHLYGHTTLAEVKNCERSRKRCKQTRAGDPRRSQITTTR